MRQRNLGGAAFFACLTLFLLGLGVLALVAGLLGGSVIYLGLAGALGGGAVFTGYETAALWFAIKPITQHTRYAWHRWPGLVAIGFMVAGFVGGHLFWPSPALHAWWVTPLVGFAAALAAHLVWGPADTRNDDVNLHS